MKNFVITFFAMAALISCASKHPGNEGQVIGGKKNLQMKVSGKTVDSKPQSPFQEIELTIENTSGDWIRISRAEVLIDDPSKSKISVVVGNDLQSWVDAKQYELKMNERNNQLAQAGLAAAGGVIAVGGAKSGNNNAVAVGAVTALSGLGWAMGSQYSKEDRDAEAALKVPGHHLYNPFAVPRKKFLRKWLLINKPVGTMVNNLVIEFETVEGQKEHYAIKM